MPEVDPYGGFASAPFPVGGRRRRSRRARRGGEVKPGPAPAPGGLGDSAVKLGDAADGAKKVMGGQIEGGRRKRSTAKKIANELKRVAKKAKKLTMKLMKMRRRK